MCSQYPGNSLSREHGPLSKTLICTGLVMPSRRRVARGPCGICIGTASLASSREQPRRLTDSMPSCAQLCCTGGSRGTGRGGSAQRTRLWPKEFPQGEHQLLSASCTTNELPELRHLSTSQEEILPAGLCFNFHLLQRPGCGAEMTFPEGILVRPFLEGAKAIETTALRHQNALGCC